MRLSHSTNFWIGIKVGKSLLAIQSGSTWISVSVHLLLFQFPSEILLYATSQNLLVNLLSIFILYLHIVCKILTFTFFFSVETSITGL